MLIYPVVYRLPQLSTKPARHQLLMQA